MYQLHIVLFINNYNQNRKIIVKLYFFKNPNYLDSKFIVIVEYLTNRRQYAEYFSQFGLKRGEIRNKMGRNLLFMVIIMSQIPIV